MVPLTLARSTCAQATDTKRWNIQSAAEILDQDRSRTSVIALCLRRPGALLYQSWFLCCETLLQAFTSLKSIWIVTLAMSACIIELRTLRSNTSGSSAPMRRLGAASLFVVVLATRTAVAQPAASDQAGPAQEEPCVQPARLFSAADYKGPFNKTVAYFSRKLEIKTVHAPHRREKQKLCGLGASDKFDLFVSNTFEPVTFVGAGFNSAIAQAENNDAAFGQGMAGYGKRYGAAFADTASSDFFHTFAFPALFRQDPRYYRQLEGGAGQRFRHAVFHAFVARSDSGQKMFNYSEWFGTVSAAALANTYHPGNRRGAGPMAQRCGISIASDMGFDVLREFWPEIVHKMKLPFRSRDEQGAPRITAPTPE